jgi:hypothetical protein
MNVLNALFEKTNVMDAEEETAGKKEEVLEEEIEA